MNKRSRIFPSHTSEKCRIAKQKYIKLIIENKKGIQQMKKKPQNRLQYITHLAQRCARRFRDMKLSKKMVLIYLIVAGMSCGISMVGLQASFGIYDRKLYEKSLQELEFFTQNVNDDLQAIENLSYTLAMNAQVQEALGKAKDTKYLSQEYYYTIMPIRKIFLDEVNIHSVVKNAMYIDRESIRISVGTDCGEVGEETYQKLLAMCKEARGGYIRLAPSGEFPYQLSGRDILETKNATLTYLGTVIITSDISQMIEKKKSELQYADSLLYVYSENGLIYGDGEQPPYQPDMREKQGYRIVKYQGERYFMSFLRAENNGWMYVNYVPYNEIFGQMAVLRYGMLLGLLVVFLVTLYGMIRLSYIITNPLYHLTKTMQLAEQGDFRGARRFLQVEDSKDEAGLLTQEFAVMLEKIDSLIHENYEKQLLLKDTRYQMLQAQINPHFMSNTLNAVNWMIKAGENRDASKMIVELGNLMQAAVATEPYVTVARELEVAQSYITIQQFRYKSRIRFTVEQEGDLTKYLVPCMILQPLIENAIHYGADQSLSVCEIDVSAKETKDGVTLCVRDNGSGMDEDALWQVRNGTIVPKGHGIGLKNIRERLRMLYTDSVFMIDSEAGVGTRVTIRIPKRTGL